MRSIAVTNQGRPKISRRLYFRLEFTNGSILYFRPAGAYGDAFRSFHVELVWVDEGAWLTEKAWKALRQCLKAGGTLRIYSTPNGLRDTTYYRLTSSEGFRVFRWPSWLNPIWSGDREQELLEFYGGRDSAGWQHEVAGEHGKPSYGAFSIEHLNLCRHETRGDKAMVFMVGCTAVALCLALWAAGAKRQFRVEFGFAVIAFGSMLLWLLEQQKEWLEDMNIPELLRWALVNFILAMVFVLLRIYERNR